MDYGKVVLVMKEHEKIQDKYINSLLEYLGTEFTGSPPNRTDILFDLIVECIVQLANSPFLHEHRNPQVQEMRIREEYQGKEISFFYDKLPDGTVQLEKKEINGKKLNLDQKSDLKEDLLRIAKAIINLRDQSKNEVELTLQPLYDEQRKIKDAIDRGKQFLDLLLRQIEEINLLFPARIRFQEGELIQAITSSNPKTQLKAIVEKFLERTYDRPISKIHSIVLTTSRVNQFLNINKITSELIQMKKENQELRTKLHMKKRNKFFYDKRSRKRNPIEKVKIFERKTNLSMKERKSK